MFDPSCAFSQPQNEPVLSYAPGTSERADVKTALCKMYGASPQIPHVIGGQEVFTGETMQVRAPYDHQRVLATFHNGGRAVAQQAISAAKKVALDWANTPFENRARVFLKAAELLAGPWRQILNAATMVGQSKTVFQAEIDSACELIDFLRFNVFYAAQLSKEQPISPPGFRNILEMRPLEGFVLAVTPFNFTAIAGNLPSAPALMGNVVVWKPAETQSLAAYYIMKLFQEAGLPDGVINVVYGEGAPVADACLEDRDLAGIHFTGSTKVFQHLWRSVGERISSYRTYPRLVGETGGKDFVLAHPSADIEALSVALVRGAFEFQGQKCSAASRAYIPASIWPQVRDRCAGLIDSIVIGDVTDLKTFMGAVIDERAWTRLASWHERMKHDSACKVIRDPGWSRETGWFAGPTLLEVSDPQHAIFHEELFGPILSVYVYPDSEWDSTIRLVNETSPYALTGAIFSQNRAAIAQATTVLRQAAGNLYWNDKPTGAVVGQQPFGGARASGTNDKAGSALNLLRWVSPRTIKETFVPPTSGITYPSMKE